MTHDQGKLTTHFLKAPPATTLEEYYDKIVRIVERDNAVVTAPPEVETVVATPDVDMVKQEPPIEIEDDISNNIPDNSHNFDNNISNNFENSMDTNISSILSNIQSINATNISRVQEMDNARRRVLGQSQSQRLTRIFTMQNS